MLHSLDPDFLALNGSPIVDGLLIKTPQTLSGQGVFSGFAATEESDEPDADES
jgi:hypothetical protein